MSPTHTWIFPAGFRPDTFLSGGPALKSTRKTSSRSRGLSGCQGPTQSPSMSSVWEHARRRGALGRPPVPAQQAHAGWDPTPGPLLHHVPRLGRKEDSPAPGSNCAGARFSTAPLREQGQRRVGRSGTASPRHRHQQSLTLKGERS